MGGKSKFKFPKPGWTSKKKEAESPQDISSPLTKAQRILGSDGVYTSSSVARADPARSLDTASNGGMSVSVSESSASQFTNDTGFDKAGDGDDSVGTSYGKTGWEAESGILPRPLWSSHGPATERLVTKRSAWTVGGDSADLSTRGMRLSSSTIDTHYDPAKMPLTISQQTSNSAMAKGLPSKINAILDIDGTLAGVPNKKKSKPAKLDLSRLRPKAFKDRNPTDPVLGNTYVMRSPSFMSMGSPSPHGSKRPPRVLVKKGSKTHLNSPTEQQPPRSRGITDTSRLHQLYDHYEQASFRDQFDEFDENDSEGEGGREQQPRHVSPETGNEPSSAPKRNVEPPPLPPAVREYDTHRTHTRDASHDSRASATTGDNSAAPRTVPQSRQHSRQQSSESAVSRHTHASKTSPPSKGRLDAERFQHSVLSLSDSSDDDDDDDEGLGSFPVPPAGRGTSPDASADSPNVGVPVDSTHSGQNQGHGPRKYTPSLDQVNEDRASNPTHLANRSQFHSNHSSVSTLTPMRFVPRAVSSSRASTGSNNTMDTVVGIQEARTVSFVPLASTAEAASRVAAANTTSPKRGNSKKVSRYNSAGSGSYGSHLSNSSDQPTPPLSPSSVEFYVKSRESLQTDLNASDATEVNKARLMAVTRQEEMLLAALRKKRAKMHESLASEAEGDRSSYSSMGSASKASAGSASNEPSPRQPKTQYHSSARPNWPKRSSSLFTGRSRENLAQDARHSASDNSGFEADIPSATSRSDAADANYTSASESTHTTATLDSRNDDEQVSLYFDHDSRKAGLPPDTPDERADFSDYMDDSDGEDLVVNERRTSRMQARRESTSPGFVVDSSTHRQSGAYRRSVQSLDQGVPISPLSAPTCRHKLQDVPEIELEEPDFDEDIDADEGPELEGLDDFMQPPTMPPPSGPLPAPPSPGKSAATAKPTSPPSTHFLHPSSARHRPSPKQAPGHIKSKRSMVRLSAVGFFNNPPPHWDDE